MQEGAYLKKKKTESLPDQFASSSIGQKRIAGSNKKNGKITGDFNAEIRFKLFYTPFACAGHQRLHSLPKFEAYPHPVVPDIG